VQALGSSGISKPEAKLSSILRGLAGLLRGWHLLSLDAPTVAATWCAAFLSAAGVSPTSPPARLSIAFLALATWLCYVGDRTQDARSALASQNLRARHHFYGDWWRKGRSSLAVLVGTVALACAATAMFGLESPLLGAYVSLTLAALLYFAWVHSGRERKARVLAKEAAVAVIFTLGCMLPALSNAAAALGSQLIPAGLLFAMLCWLNCVAIERWEGLGVVNAHAHSSTRWAARNLTGLLLGGALAAVALAVWRRTGHRPVMLASLLAPCIAGAFVLLALLERWRQRLSVESLRVLADVALLTPLAWWLAERIAH